MFIRIHLYNQFQGHFLKIFTSQISGDPSIDQISNTERTIIMINSQSFHRVAKTLIIGVKVLVSYGGHPVSHLRIQNTAKHPHDTNNSFCNRLTDYIELNFIRRLTLFLYIESENRNCVFKTDQHANLIIL